MTPITHLTLATCMGAALLPTAALAAAAPSCSARASERPPAIVELYTSEGCSSCPPADRWLSNLKGRDDVIALAFHVNYWDQLGWPDRFATAATTERQRQLQRTNGAPYVYTPQVLQNGRDWRDWGGMPTPAPASAVRLALQRDGNAVTASVGPGAQPMAGYWAVVEDGHSSRVRAGENAGRTLVHDHVVTLYRPVDAWPAQSTRQLSLSVPPTAGTPARRIVFVVTDAVSQRPLQAVALGC